jgi:hypothetical protein
MSRARKMPATEEELVAFLKSLVPSREPALDRAIRAFALSREQLNRLPLLCAKHAPPSLAARMGYRSRGRR